MNIIEFLNEVANCAPNKAKVDKIIKAQPEEIQRAIKKNDGNFIKDYISNSEFYANETTVTIY